MAIFDYDADGRPDIYLVNGSTSAMRGKEKAPRAALYRNLGNWKFEDVTDKAGVANERWGFSVAVGDYNNDGAQTCLSATLVSRVFIATTVTARSPTSQKSQASRARAGAPARAGAITMAMAVSIFSSGLRADRSRSAAETSDVGKSGVAGCQFRGVPVMCGPRGLPGEGDTLYHQKADGTFEDVSVKAGVNDKDKYYGFSSAFVHVDDDKLLDLIVVNDSTPISFTSTKETERLRRSVIRQVWR